MKITRITLQNFRAFRGDVPLDVDLSAGKNLLVFGENGSGKTSLFFALNDFLEASDKTLDIGDTPFRNLFAEPADETFVNLQFSDGNRYKWSVADTENQTADIRVVNKTKGFIDYKKLLHTYFLQQEEKSVNVFRFFVETLLANSFNDTGAWTFGDKWTEINNEIQKTNNARQSELIQGLIAEFNGGLTVKLAEIEAKAQNILQEFYQNLTIKLSFGNINYESDVKARAKTGKRIENDIINLTVDFYAVQKANHHQFLNEAKLSAVALSVYLASLPVLPNNEPRIIALDDVLIGLDMANRLPILDILEKHFADDQIFFFTYDRAWFDIVKSRVKDNEWKKLEFFTTKNIAIELPVVQDSKTYIEKADIYYDANDYKAAAVYARSHFEKIMKKFCQRKNVTVRFNEEVRFVSANDLWMAIEKKSAFNLEENNTKGKSEWVITDNLIKKINRNSKTLLNEAVHSSSITIHGAEMREAIDAVKELEAEFTPIWKK